MKKLANMSLPLKLPEQTTIVFLQLMLITSLFEDIGISIRYEVSSKVKYVRFILNLTAKPRA